MHLNKIKLLKKFPLVKLRPPYENLHINKIYDLSKYLRKNNIKVRDNIVDKK